MPVLTSNSQGGETADQRDYYRARIRDTDEDWRKRSFKSIIEFIDQLEIEFPQTEIWLLRSHDRLVLMDAPDYDAGDWLVSVEKVLITEFHFRYKMLLIPQFQTQAFYSSHEGSTKPSRD